MKAAPLFPACQDRLRLFRPFDTQNRRTALGTDPVRGFIPGGKAAFRVLVARIKPLPFLGSPFYQHTLAILLRTWHPRSCWGCCPDVLAFRIAGTGDKRSELSILNHHRPAALLTCALLFPRLNWDFNSNPSLVVSDIIGGILTLGISGTAQEKPVFA